MTALSASRTVTAGRLHQLLDAAVKLELSTIPPYLCALYTIRAGTNQEASLIIRSVVVEEMLHMVLAANVLNAIGGAPAITGPDNAPHYPHELPDGVVLDLLPFGPQAIEAFLSVENPEYRAEQDELGARRAGVHASHAVKMSNRPTTIGAFYDEITATLEAAAEEIGEQALFCGDPARQVGGDYYYAGGGTPIVVTDLASAKAALHEIVEQGEGEMRTAYDADGDLAHYYRFEQLKYDRAYLPTDELGAPTGPSMGVDFTAVFPMITNPRLEDLADPELRDAARAANLQWSLLLMQIEQAFNGAPERLIDAVQTMFKLRDAMLVLLANPLPGHPGLHAGPTFEWEPRAERPGPQLARTGVSQ